MSVHGRRTDHEASNPPNTAPVRALRQGAQSPCKVGIPMAGTLFATKSYSEQVYIADQRDKDVHEPHNSPETTSVYCYDTRGDDWNKQLQ